MNKGVWGPGVLFVLSLIVGGLMTGCGADTLVARQTAQTTVPGANILEQLVSDVGFGDFMTLDIAGSQELRNEGIEEEDIDSVVLTSLTLEVVDPPSGQDLSFLDYIVFIARSPGETDTRVAEGGPFVAGETFADIYTTGLELKPFVVAESMSILTEAGGTNPSEDTTILATATFEVNVNVRGAIF